MRKKDRNMFRRKRDLIKEVRTNPRIYCYDECSHDWCQKHKSKVDRTKLYLFAKLKDTPYCPHEDREMYEEAFDDEVRIERCEE